MNTATQSATALAELLYPSCWLVSGLEWHGDGPTAEAAAAVAPAMIPRDAVSHDAFQVLGCADLYARMHGLRVVFFSDLTRLFTKAGTSWTQLGVDYENALRELHDGSFPAMFLTISEQMYLAICDPGTSHATGAARLDRDEAPPFDRELARQAITRQLAGDWPAYMHRLIAAGRVSLTH
jgi:hypothetical protein